MVISKDLGYISAKRFDLVSEQITDLRQMLNGYIRYLREKKTQTRKESDQSYSTKSEPEFTNEGRLPIDVLIEHSDNRSNS